MQDGQLIAIKLWQLFLFLKINYFRNTIQVYYHHLIQTRNHILSTHNFSDISWLDLQDVYKPALVLMLPIHCVKTKHLAWNYSFFEYFETHRFSNLLVQLLIYYRLRSYGNKNSYFQHLNELSTYQLKIEYLQWIKN